MSLLDNEAKKINSATASQMTKVVKTFFGDEFVAMSKDRRRTIRKVVLDESGNLASLILDQVTEKTWVEALSAAKQRWTAYRQKETT